MCSHRQIQFRHQLLNLLADDLAPSHLMNRPWLPFTTTFLQCSMAWVDKGTQSAQLRIPHIKVLLPLLSPTFCAPHTRVFPKSPFSYCKPSWLPSLPEKRNSRTLKTVEMTPKTRYLPTDLKLRNMNTPNLL